MYLRELSQTKQALGGDVTLSIITDISDAAADLLFDDMWRQVFMFERSFSRFLPMSELTLFNRSAGVKTKISSEFRDILTTAKQFSQTTNGLYNPFVTPVLQRVGYSKSALAGYERDKQIDYTDRRVVEADRLEIGIDWALIPYKTALDIGGCGKGYLADQLSKYLLARSVKGYWLSLSGDIVTNGLDENGNKMTINIQDSSDLGGAKDYLVQCPTEQFAIATSGTFSRRGQDDNSGWHHIIDPSTLKPAETDILLATVCSDRCVDSDVLASCAIILGSKKAPAFLKSHGATAYMLQCQDENGMYFDKLYGSYIKKFGNKKLTGVMQSV